MEAALSLDLALHRADRLKEVIREELEELIGYEMSDPRIGGTSVSEVVLTPDFRQCYVRMVLDGSPEEQAQTLKAIEHGKQFLRHQLTERLALHRTPDLHFEAALPADLAAKVPQLLKRIRRGRAKDGSSDRPPDEKNATD
ncbi:MAG TPA: 30S ribosome-binding factor RbfA [Bryobacteraceae bacterium]